MINATYRSILVELVSGNEVDGEYDLNVVGFGLLYECLHFL